MDVELIANFVKGRRKKRRGPAARRPVSARPKGGSSLEALRNQDIRPLWILNVVAALAVAGGLAMLLTC